MWTSEPDRPGIGSCLCLLPALWPGADEFSHVEDGDTNVDLTGLLWRQLGSCDSLAHSRNSTQVSHCCSSHSSPNTQTPLHILFDCYMLGIQLCQHAPLCPTAGLQAVLAANSAFYPHLQIQAGLRLTGWQISQRETAVALGVLKGSTFLSPPAILKTGKSYIIRPFCFFGILIQEDLNVFRNNNR